MATLRVWYLWLKQIVRNALSVCSICKTRGVTSVSLRYPKAMCSECDAAYQRALKEADSVSIEALIFAYGPQEFLFRYGMKSLNPLAESQEDLENDELAYSKLINTGCVMDEEDFPCFDTFPGPPPTFNAGHPSRFDH